MAQLRDTMSEDEFTRWILYRKSCLFPTRRLEYGLAMVALKISQFAGSKSATLSHFLLDLAQSAEVPEEPKKMDPIVKALTTGKVFYLGSKRKKDK